MKLSKYFISGLSLMLLSSLVCVPVNAKHIKMFHPKYVEFMYETHTVKHHKKLPKIKPNQTKHIIKSVKKSNVRTTKGQQISNLDNQGNYFNNLLRINLIDDINYTREQNGVRPLKVINLSQTLANYRNPYVQYAYNHLDYYHDFPHMTSNPMDNWVHGGDTHVSGYDYLIKHNISFHHWGENATNWSNKFNAYGDRQPNLVNNSTPSGIAFNINNGMINHDNSEGNQNGHRINELNPEWKYIGVGVTYDPENNLGSVNEQYLN